MRGTAGGVIDESVNVCILDILRRFHMSTGCDLIQRQVIEPQKLSHRFAYKGSRFPLKRLNIIE